MSNLSDIQTRLDELYEALEANDHAIDELRSTLDSLNSEAPSNCCESATFHSSGAPYWMDYIFPPNSKLLRYKCSECGYITTYKLLSCPRCKEYMTTGE